MPPLFSTEQIITDFIYSLLITILCIIVFLKTKELYKLSRHKGIHYFRNAFLFFGISYVTQFLLRITMFGFVFNEAYLPPRIIFPISILLTGFFSTLAITHLFYTFFWKQIKYKSFLTAAMIVTLVISLLSMIFRSPLILAIVQLSFVLFAGTLSFQSKKKPAIKLVYTLISVFWLIDLFIIHSRWLLPFEIKLPLQIISLTIFGYLCYRVTKWTR